MFAQSCSQCSGYDIELRKRRIDAYQDDVEPHPAFIFAPERPETR